MFLGQLQRGLEHAHVFAPAALAQPEGERRHHGDGSDDEAAQERETHGGHRQAGESREVGDRQQREHAPVPRPIFFDAKTQPRTSLFHRDREAGRGPSHAPGLDRDDPARGHSGAQERGDRLKPFDAQGQLDLALDRSGEIAESCSSCPDCPLSLEMVLSARSRRCSSSAMRMRSPSSSWRYAITLRLDQPDPSYDLDAPERSAPSWPRLGARARSIAGSAERPRAGGAAPASWTIRGRSRDQAAPSRTTRLALSSPG